jgi:hypothetical protein
MEEDQHINVFNPLSVSTSSKKPLDSPGCVLGFDWAKFVDS